MQHLDLFSGIGGFALAAQRVGWSTIGFCEIDPYCLGVLERRFDPDGWFSLPGSEHRGAPSGTRRASELAWIAPDWVVIENVYHTWRRWVPELRRRLHERGYSSLPLRVQAKELGAPHRRARCYLVANADSEQLRELSRWWLWQGREVAAQLAGTWDFAPRRLGADDGLPDAVDRRHAIGNAILPQAAELVFRGIVSVCSGDTAE